MSAKTKQTVPQPINDESFYCVGCEEIKDVEDDTTESCHDGWTEPLREGQCIGCKKQFACADCCSEWSISERHACNECESKPKIQKKLKRLVKLAGEED